MLSPKNLLAVFLMAFICCLSAYGQVEPVFLGDINQEEDGSNPRNFVKAGGSVYFIASETIGFEVWRTDGTEHGTVSLDWFNELYDRTDWKFLIPYDQNRFLIQTHDALYLTTGIEGTLQELSSQAQDEHGKVSVNNGLVFWNEPSNDDHVDVVKAFNGVTQSEILLDDYELVRFINLDIQTLIVCKDESDNYKTFISDGTTNGTVIFSEQNVMAADEDATKVVFSALDLEGDLFQLYSKDKATSEIDQLTFFNETAIPNYSRIEPIVILREGIVFFTKQVERQGRYWFLSELHRLENGQVSFVGDENDSGFEVDVIIENDSALTVLGGQKLYSIDDSGAYHWLQNSSSIMNYNKRDNPISYYQYDGSRLFYFAGASGNSELIVSTRSSFETESVKRGSRIAQAIVKPPNFTLSRQSAGTVVFDNLVIAAGSEDSDANELWAIDWQTGEEFLVKNISRDSKALTGADFRIYNDKLYITSEGRIWVTDGTPEGTLNITSSDFTKFAGTPRFVTGFDHLYVFGVVSEGNSDSNVMIKIENDQPVGVYEGAAYGEGNLYYLFRAGADAVFLYSGIESFALTIERDEIRLRLPYSIQTPLPARASTAGYLRDEHFLSLPDQVFFRGWTSEHGFEPWVIDIEKFEIRPLGDLNPESHSYPIDFTEFNDKIVFRSRESDYRQSLFMSDGTSDGTSIYFTDFIDADETKEASISRPKLINGSLYFTSFYDGTERLFEVDHKDEFRILQERQQTNWSRAPQLMEFGHNLILHDWEDMRFYNRATGETGELNWSIIPSRNLSIGNYFFDAASYGQNFGALYRWNKLTLEEELYSDDPSEQLPIATLGRKLVVLKYAEGFGHELWALDVGRQDRLVHLPEMKVSKGESFLPYISDIESANFTYSVSSPEAISYENGQFYAESIGTHTLDLVFDEDEIFSAGTMSIIVEITDGSTITGISEIVDLKVYPNPTSNEITLELPNEKLDRLRVLDLSGKVWVEKKNISQRKLILPLQSLRYGVYLLHFSTLSGAYGTEKIVVR